MNENILSKKSFFNKLNDFLKANLKSVIIFLSSSFILFLSFQIYSMYSLNKIKKNSISFYESQDIENIDIIDNSINNLINENNFYNILSKLKLIQFYLKQKNNQNVINIYQEILNNSDLNNIHKSAIAAKAAFDLINLSLNDLSKDNSKTINKFISFIDDDLISYEGIKLELYFLLKLLEAEINNIEYTNLEELSVMYDKITNSENVSIATKDRINKIHEYFSYK